MKKKIIAIVLNLIEFLVLSLVVIHYSNSCISNKTIQMDIPEKPARIEELPPCIDVTSRIRKPIELVREKAIYENRNCKVNLIVEEMKKNQMEFLANAD